MSEIEKNKDYDEQKGTAILVKFIDEHGENLTKWEIDFIANMIDNPPAHFNKMQIDKINEIYEERCK